MTPITKEALIERGFKSEVLHNYKKKKDYELFTLKGEDFMWINVTFDGLNPINTSVAQYQNPRILSPFGSPIIFVPNGRTVEQIDQLISLFITP